MKKNILLAAVFLFQAIGMVFAQSGASSGYRVHGRVNPSEDQTPGVPVAGIPGAPPPARGNVARLVGDTAWDAPVDRQALIQGDGTFEFPGVAPGFYQVEVIPRMSVDSADVAVRDRDVEVNIGRRWIRVSGAVTVDGGGPVPPFELEFANVTAAGERDRLDRRFVVQAGGRFTVDMPAGRYRLTASGLPAVFRLANAAQPFQLSHAEPADLALVLTTSGPAPWVKVSGRMEGVSAGATAAKVTLAGFTLAAPLSAAVNPDGSFEFLRILPGRYEVRTVPSMAETARVLTVGDTGVSDLRIAVPPALKDAVGEFVRIAPGVFMMGCPAVEAAQCNQQEKPAHRVGITRAYEIGKYEVTQAQWEAAMGTNPSVFKGPARPVDSVLWQDAQAFIAKLNTLGDGYRYRLPTEAEWEYAARAGSSGPDPSLADSEAFGWFNTNSGGETHPVGQKQPNAWGLHDMRGNVTEWVSDLFDDAYYANSPELDPTGPSSSQTIGRAVDQHVSRGGQFSFHPGAPVTRVTGRILPAVNSNHGFRLVREPIQPGR